MATSTPELDCEQYPSAPTATDSTTLGDVARNIGLLTILWFAYSAVRSVTSTSDLSALANARALWDFQERFGFAVEADVQELIGNTATFAAANIYYLFHFPVTIAFLFLAIAIDRRGVFARSRDAMIAATSVGLVVHLVFPLAPPRMLNGFIDTAAIIGPNPYSLPGAEAANQFAAMPSMHVGWAVIVGLGLLSLSSRRWVRVLAVAHPALTSVVVVITANHYLVDIVAGAALAFVGWRVAVWRLRRSYTLVS